MTRSPFSGRAMRQTLSNIISYFLSASLLLKLVDVYSKLIQWFNFLHMQTMIAKWTPCRPHVKYAETISGVDITVPTREFYKCSPLTHSLMTDLEEYLGSWGVAEKVAEIVLQTGVITQTEGTCRLTMGDTVTILEAGDIRQ